MNAAFVFSGQGAQFVGMGKDIADNSKAAAGIYQQADEVLGYSISDICFNGPAEKLTESRFCQPAIYTTSIACLEAFREKNPSIQPVGCGGLSLGEYAALYCAGAFTFADGLKLISKRGELMDEACKENEGGMASVLGGDAGIIAEVCKACDIDVANLNCPGQIVISGDKALVKDAIVSLKEKGLRKVIPLRVAGAYHSRLMSSAGEKLGEVLQSTAIGDPTVPITQNYTGTFASDSSEICENLKQQVAGSVRWEDCVRSLIGKGADTFIEFGPGTVLTGLVKRIDSSMTLVNIGKNDELSAFEA